MYIYAPAKKNNLPFSSSIYPFKKKESSFGNKETASMFMPSVTPKSFGNNIIQAKLAASGYSSASPPASAINRRGEQLPSSVRGKMERAFQADFSKVRVEVGTNAPAIGALAYTQGNTIHMAPEQYHPESKVGQELLAHELAHVEQQRHGRVQAPFQTKSETAVINQDVSLENEADHLARQAVSGQPARVKGINYNHGIQLMKEEKEEKEENNQGKNNKKKNNNNKEEKKAPDIRSFFQNITDQQQGFKRKNNERNLNSSTGESPPLKKQNLKPSPSKKTILYVSLTKNQKTKIEKTLLPPYLDKSENILNKNKNESELEKKNWETDQEKVDPQLEEKKFKEDEPKELKIKNSISFPEDFSNWNFDEMAEILKTFDGSVQVTENQKMENNEAEPYPLIEGKIEEQQFIKLYNDMKKEIEDRINPTQSLSDTLKKIPESLEGFKRNNEVKEIHQALFATKQKIKEVYKIKLYEDLKNKNEETYSKLSLLYQQYSGYLAKALYFKTTKGISFKDKLFSSCVTLMKATCAHIDDLLISFNDGDSVNYFNNKEPENFQYYAGATRNISIETRDGNKDYELGHHYIHKIGYKLASLQGTESNGEYPPARDLNKYNSLKTGNNTAFIQGHIVPRKVGGRVNSLPANAAPFTNAFNLFDQTNGIRVAETYAEKLLAKGEVIKYDAKVNYDRTLSDNAGLDAPLVKEKWLPLIPRGVTIRVTTYNLDPNKNAEDIANWNQKKTEETFELKQKAKGVID